MARQFVSHQLCRALVIHTMGLSLTMDFLSKRTNLYVEMVCVYAGHGGGKVPITGGCKIVITALSTQRDCWLNLESLTQLLEIIFLDKRQLNIMVRIILVNLTSKNEVR